MSEHVPEQAGDRQDPAEPKRVDQAVETEPQPEPTSGQPAEAMEMEPAPSTEPAQDDE